MIIQTHDWQTQKNDFHVNQNKKLVFRVSLCDFIHELISLVVGALPYKGTNPMTFRIYFYQKDIKIGKMKI